MKVRVPVDRAPPVNVLGLSISEIREAADTLSVVVFVVPYDAVIVTDVKDATPLVVILNVALFVPAAIVTPEGTFAVDALLLCRLTNNPPVGAAPFIVTVPVERFPPTTDAGLLASDDNVGAITVRLEVRVTP